LLYIDPNKLGMVLTEVERLIKAKEDEAKLPQGVEGNCIMLIAYS